MTHDHPSIFISIASYRDKLCPKTLESIYTMAAHPEVVYVGICQQNDVNDKDCLQSALSVISKYKDNIRIIRLGHIEAKGPTYARFLCASLYDGEKYFLQIDSHSLFEKNWDTLLIAMITDLQQSGVKKPVISHYPPNLNDYKGRNPKTDHITTLCRADFNDNDLIFYRGAQWVKAKDLPQRNAYVSGNMFFCEASFLQELPYDPELDYLFWGEEILLSARFYTHGWDIFTPNKNVVFHYYIRDSSPKFWDIKDFKDSAPAEKKMRYIMGYQNKDHLTDRQIYSLQFYGLGKERTLEQYLDFAGIDIKNKKVVKDMCQQQENYTNSPNTFSKENNISSCVPFLLIIICSLLLFVFILFFYQYSKI